MKKASLLLFVLLILVFSVSATVENRSVALKNIILQTPDTENLEDFYTCPIGGCLSGSSGNFNYLSTGIYNDYEFESYLKFNIDSLNENYTIDSSQLCTYVYSAFPASSELHLYSYGLYNNTWDENITYNETKIRPLSDQLYNVNLTNYGWACFNITNYTENNKQNNTISFMINASHPDSTNAFNMYSKESDNTTLRPKLNISYHRHNSIPRVVNFSLIPNNISNQSDINCSFKILDDEFENVTMFIRYEINDVDINLTQTIQTQNNTLTYCNELISSNYTDVDDAISATLMPSNYYYSYLYFTENFIVEDSTSPTIENISVPTTGYKDNSLLIQFECYDNAHVQDAYVTIITSFNTTTKFSCIQSGDTWYKSYVPTETGSYTITNFTCIDPTGNSIINTTEYDSQISLSPDTPSGGSGGTPSEPDLDFAIVGLNALNTETAQLSIRPSSTRELCLDIINYADLSQTISLECITPDGQDFETCSWIQLDTNLITVQPSEEIRETVCLNITTPFDIVVGDRYIIEIKGTVTYPNTYKGASTIHKVTMWVTDPSEILKQISEKLSETTISDSFFNFLKKYFKTDIREISLPNFINPLLILSHIFMFLLTISILKKPNTITHITLQLILLGFSIGAMFEPVVLLWVYIFELIFWLGNVFIEALLKF